MRYADNLGLSISMYTQNLVKLFFKILSRNEIMKNGMVDVMMNERDDGQFKSSMATVLVKFDQVFEKEMLFE